MSDSAAAKAKPVKSPSKFQLAKAILGIKPLSPEQAEALDAKNKRKAEVEKFTAAQKARQRDRKNDARQFEAEVHYERLQKATREAADDLADLPGAEPYLRQILAALDAAQQLADQQDFAGAQKLLEKLKAEDLLEKGLAAEAKATRATEKRFPEEFARAQALVDSLRDGMLSNAEVAQFTADAGRLTAPLRSPDADADIAATIAERLEVLAEEIAAAETAAEAGRLRFLEAQARCVKAVHDARDTASDAEMAPILRSLEAANAFAASKDWQLAADTAEATAGLAETTSRDAAQGRADWERLGTTLPALIERANALAANDNPALAERQADVASIATRLYELLDEVEAGDVGRRLPFASAATLIEEATAQLSESEAHLAAAADFEPSRDAARQRMDAILDKVAGQLETMRAAIAATVECDAATVPAGTFGDRLAQIRTDWTGRLAAAVTEAELGEEAISQRLEALSADIAAATADNAAHVTLHAEHQLAEARDRLAAVEAACAAPLTKLFVTSLAEAEKYQGLVDTIMARAAAASGATLVNRLVPELEELLAKMSQLAEALPVAQDQQRAALQAKLLDLREVLAAFDKKIESQEFWQQANPVRKDAPAYRAQYEAMVEEASQLQSLLPVADMAGLDDLSDQLDALMANVRMSSTALEGGKDEDGKQVVTLISLQKSLYRLRDRCSGNKYAEYVGNTQASLLADIATLDAELATLTLPAASARLEALKARYVPMKEALAAARTGYKQFHAAVSNARKYLKENKDAFRVAPDALADLTARIDACERSAKTEGEMDRCIQTMFNLMLEAQALVADPAKAAQAQATAEAAKDRASEAAARFKGQFDSFTKILKGYDAIHGKDRKEIEKLTGMAKTTFENSGDYDTAMVQLGAAAQRAATLQKYPDGATMAARNNLPKVIAKWKAVVANFNASLGVLESRIAGIEDSPTYDDARRAALDTIKAIRPLFLATAFDAAAARITAKGSDDKTRAAAREEGLRMVRRYVAYIENDFRFRELAANPFDDGVKSDLVAARIALADLDHNLLISGASSRIRDFV